MTVLSEISCQIISQEVPSNSRLDQCTITVLHLFPGPRFYSKYSQMFPSAWMQPVYIPCTNPSFSTSFTHKFSLVSPIFLNFHLNFPAAFPRVSLHGWPYVLSIICKFYRALQWVSLSFNKDHPKTVPQIYLKGHKKKTTLF